MSDDLLAAPKDGKFVYIASAESAFALAAGRDPDVALQEVEQLLSEAAAN